MTTAATPETVAATYFEAWQAGDFDRLRSIFAEDVSFVGALGTADGAQACADGLRGMHALMTGLDVKRRWVDGPDVITWFELHTEGRDPIPVVNWSRVEDGKVTRIRVTFDPRPLTG
jgi:hypothetical protein